MAINNPGEDVGYCDGATGARFEWTNPDRTIPNEDWTWSGETFGLVDMPIKYALDVTLGDLLETLILEPGGTVTSDTLNLNHYYTFVVTGKIDISGVEFYDACFYSLDGEQEPSDRLTVDDNDFQNMFFDAANDGAVEYDPITHSYSVGYVGNGAPVTFSLAGTSGGTDSLEIKIYPNEYSISIRNAGTYIEKYQETRERPFESLNLACGGDCPSRSSFNCECNGTRHCYWDDDAGTITKIFSGKKE